MNDIKREEKDIFRHKHHISGFGRPPMVGQFLYARLLPQPRQSGKGLARFVEVYVPELPRA